MLNIIFGSARTSDEGHELTRTPSKVSTTMLFDSSMLLPGQRFQQGGDLSVRRHAHCSMLRVWNTWRCARCSGMAASLVLLFRWEFCSPELSFVLALKYSRFETKNIQAAKRAIEVLVASVYSSFRVRRKNL